MLVTPSEQIPFPVAYRWRAVEAAVSARSFKEALEAILAAAEVLMCYAANVGLAIAHIRPSISVP